MDRPRDGGCGGGGGGAAKSKERMTAGHAVPRTEEDAVRTGLTGRRS